jgi:uncharacterized membrane protein
MTIGPLQLIWVKFADESRTKPISQALTAARRTGVIRLVDMLYVYKNMNGELQSKEMSDLADLQKAEYGLVLKGLLGIRASYKTAGDADKVVAAMALVPGDFGLSSEQVQEMAKDLPNGGSAMMVLFEHTWAVPLKEAILTAGGELVTQSLLSPEALALGGTTLEDAVASAKRIEDEAAIAAAANKAEADQKLAEAQQTLAQAGTDAEAKLAEAQRLIDEANAQAAAMRNDAEKEAAARVQQAKLVADAAIVASVRAASDSMKQADEQARQAELEAAEKVAQADEIAKAKVIEGDQIAQQKIEEGTRTAEEIKSAAVLEAMKILMDAKLITKESAQDAVTRLTNAALIDKKAAVELIYLGK